MARVTADTSGLTIDFALWERPFVGRGRLRLSGEEIAEVRVVERPLRHHLGPRAGLWVTGLLKVGLFGITPRCLASVRRGAPALHLRVTGGSRAFGEVLVSTAEAPALARRLAAAR